MFLNTFRLGEAVIGLALLVVAVVIGFMSWQMPLGSAAAPGPGAFPLVLSFMLLLSSVGVIARAFRREPASGESEDVTFNLGPVTLVTLSSAAAIFAFEPLGFAITAFLYVAILFWRVGGIKLPFAVAGSLVAVAISWLFFVKALGVQLPLGPLGF